MELNGIVQSLDNKSILVTGSTGFLSKMFVEKLLRVQPNMKQLFLLLRPADASSATQRLHNDVTGKEVFRVLRKKHGVRFDSFIAEKVTPVFGDIGLQNLGINDSALINKMHKEVDIVANFAATTSYDERYDVALDVNTMGAKHVLDFAEKCDNLEMILHISTAYIYTGEAPGLMLEKPFDISQTMKDIPKILDIDEERKLVQDRLNELKAAQVSKKEETAAMQKLGLERAKLYGLPNTYVFTKAMGEMIISQSLNRNIPVVIARPTIVSSTIREPFPGWIEGLKAFDPFVLYCGRGKLPCFVGNHESFLDIIPGDMVVNAMIVAMMNHTKSNNRSFSVDDDDVENNNDHQYIYHMGSSAHRKQMNLIMVVKYAYDYFCKNPLMDKYGNAVEIVKPVFFPSLDSFRQHVYDNYVLPKKERQVSVARRLAEIYEPFLLFKKIFDDSATEKLRMSMRAKGSEEADMFDFDPKHIDWRDYIMNIHIPGLIKYVIEGFNTIN
ncbi:hypothetical protein MKX01_042916 [Papaver californicum]|nr:hypothetical protein MKX01_042916 [Papaver californicum]